MGPYLGIFKPHLETRDSYVYGLNQIDKSLCGPRATAARAETGDGDIGDRGGGTTRQQHPLRATVPRKVGLPRRSKGCAPCERVISTSEERVLLRLTAGRTYGPCDEYIQVNLNLNL